MVDMEQLCNNLILYFDSKQFEDLVLNERDGSKQEHDLEGMEV